MSFSLRLTGARAKLDGDKKGNATFRRYPIEHWYGAGQTVLKDAGLSQIGGGVLGVDAFTSDLLSSGYSKLSQSDASAGDIVNLGGDHVGICLSGGCTTMISNSNSKGTFSWVDSPATENASVGGAYLEFYQHDP